MTIDMNELKALILFRLQNRRIWGAKHTAIENLTKSIPPHLKHEAKNAIKELIKEGFLIVKPTSYGKQVSLNINKSKEIKEFVDEHLA